MDTNNKKENIEVLYDIDCSYCYQTFATTEVFLGTKDYCPHCNHIIEMPALNLVEHTKFTISLDYRPYEPVNELYDVVCSACDATFGSAKEHLGKKGQCTICKSTIDYQTLDEVKHTEFWI